MAEHKTTRKIPAGKSASALVEHLLATYPSAADGFRTEKDGYIILVFKDAATQTDINAAAADTEAWDFDTLTQNEQNHAALNTDFQNVVQRYVNGNLANKTPDEIYTLVQGMVDGWASLADAKTGLREILPFLAAGLQVYLREKLL